MHGIFDGFIVADGFSPAAAIGIIQARGRLLPTNSVAKVSATIFRSCILTMVSTMLGIVIHLSSTALPSTDIGHTPCLPSAPFSSPHHLRSAADAERRNVRMNPVCRSTMSSAVGEESAKRNVRHTFSATRDQGRRFSNHSVVGRYR